MIVERYYTGFYAAERDRNRAQYAQRRTRETRVSSSTSSPYEVHMVEIEYNKGVTRRKSCLGK